MEFEHDAQQPAPQSNQGPTMRFEQEQPNQTRIKVIGVGGGGCNAVSDMVQEGFPGVEFYAVNTDFQALESSNVPNKLQVGSAITSGLGTGANPQIGEKAAQDAESEIKEILAGADMVFITAGMGGGTGTGAAPVIAKLAREMNILNVAIVTKPFTFEGRQRMRRAQEGIEKLKEHVDTSIVILNDKLMETVGANTPLTEAFTVANSVLAQGIRAISDLISMPGLINVDFHDVRTVMGETGGAVMGVGIGKGENRSVQAVRKACHSPLQEKIVIDGARGILINITGGPDITMQEINEATQIIYESADEDANVIFGVVIDERMSEELRVTIIATGFENELESAPTGAISASKPLRPAATSFNAPPQPPRIEPAAPPQSQPDEEPALQRKQRESQMSGGVAQQTRPATPQTAPQAPQPPKPQAQNSPPAHNDNPLKSWDQTENKVQGTGQTAPDPDSKNPSSAHTHTATFQAPRTQQAPTFGDVEAGNQPATYEDDEAPSEIPALERRRKKRMFE